MSRIEWPTLGVAILCYGLWAVALFLVAGWSPVLAVAMLTLAVTLHSSLQHEVLHGHPFAAQWASVALVFPALGLVIPYGRFRDLHLAHHRDEFLTDPYDDPETTYLDPVIWARLPRGLRLILNANNTLFGRIILGPVISQIVFMAADWRLIRAGDRAVARDWVLHGLGVIPVVALVIWSPLPFWAYAIAAYLGNGILRIRTFLEHRAHEKARARSVVIEDRGMLAFLFLNNNFHAVHHAHPQLPWYALPGRYFSDRDKYLARNGAYMYRSYGQIFRLFALRRKEPVPHPLYPEKPLP